MAKIEVAQLKYAVESQHGCTATLAQSVPVKETFVVRSLGRLRIHGHLKATQAYARSSPIERSDKCRFFAVLHVPPITSPVEAVRAAIVAEQRGQKPMAKKKFRASVSTDFDITENGRVVGSIRVKPSGLLWRPKGKHSWYRLEIRKFAAMAKKRGTEVEK